MNSKLSATNCIFSLFVDFSENCTFEHLQLDMICTVNFDGNNKGFQNYTVPGVVTLEQNSITFCNLTEKSVTIYKCECSAVGQWSILGWMHGSCTLVSLLDLLVSVNVHSTVMLWCLQQNNNTTGSLAFSSNAQVFDN